MQIPPLCVRLTSSLEQQPLKTMTVMTVIMFLTLRAQLKKRVSWQTLISRLQLRWNFISTFCDSSLNEFIHIHHHPSLEIWAQCRWFQSRPQRPRCRLLPPVHLLTPPPSCQNCAFTCFPRLPLAQYFSHRGATGHFILLILNTSLYILFLSLQVALPFCSPERYGMSLRFIAFGAVRLYEVILNTSRLWFFSDCVILRCLNYSTSHSPLSTSIGEAAASSSEVLADFWPCDWVTVRDWSSTNLFFFSTIANSVFFWILRLLLLPGLLKGFVRTQRFFFFSLPSQHPWLLLA